MLLKMLIVCCVLPSAGQQVNSTSDDAAASELVIPLFAIGEGTDSMLTVLLAAVKELQDEGITTQLVSTTTPAILVIRGLKDEDKQRLIRIALKLEQSPQFTSLSTSDRVTSLSGAHAAAVGPAATVTCRNVTNSCCLRSLPPDSSHIAVSIQSQLDLLDSHVQDGVFSSPLACPDKMHVFVLSSGIEATHSAFANVTVIVEEDCPTGTGWVTGVDVTRFGLATAGMIVTPYGVTPNVILHSVKMAQSVNPTSQQWNCSIGRVRSWLAADASRKAVVVATYYDSTSSSSDTSSLVQSLVDDFGERMLFIAHAYDYPPASVSDTLAVDYVFLFSGTLYYSNGRTTDVAVETGDAVTPSLGNSESPYALSPSQGAGVAAGVLSQYWLEHPTLTGNAIRDLIQDNPTSDVHAAADFPRYPTSTVDKVIKYRCTAGCPKACRNGGFPVAGQCRCPQGTAGDECEEFVCGSDCGFGHPAHCHLYVQCPGGKPRVVSCRKRSGLQLYFDVVSRSCKLPCEAQVRPGCVFAP